MNINVTAFTVTQKLYYNTYRMIRYHDNIYSEKQLKDISIQFHL